MKHSARAPDEWLHQGERVVQPFTVRVICS
jgi:hypothetical protein